MTTIILGLGIAGIFFVIMFLIAESSRRGTQRASIRTGKNPNRVQRAIALVKAKEEISGWTDLGALQEVPLANTVASLERAIPGDYTQQIKQRYLTEHPNVSEDYFELLMFELKRYFVLCSVLKSVPMFSDEVDGVWHEMIMYTREYERFGKELLGGTLHHAPAAESTPDPGGRAWFDLIYSQLFRFHGFTQVAWGPFFRNAIDSARLNELQSLSEEQLRRSYFREDADEQLVNYLLGRLRHQPDEAGFQSEDNYRADALNGKRFDMTDPAFGVYFAGLMVMYSIYNQDTYAMEMEKQLPRDPNIDSSQAGGFVASGCAGDGGNGDSSGTNSCSSDGGNSSNNSSCSSSSCSSGSSSCGGGGSSCGGGGS
ncbi:hypothetical protein SAMN05444162_3605 [Paenibacillaceae bacterium GAS479]|nr:hypothetical protein SAMN05444162_3605 [Paenibacillaceae bacterium GAS479]